MRLCPNCRTPTLKKDAIPEGSSQVFDYVCEKCNRGFNDRHSDRYESRGRA